MSEYSYFKFSIKNEKYQSYKKIGSFIFLLNGLSFYYLSAAGISSFSKILCIAIGSVSIFYACYSFFTRSTDRSYVVIYIISALVWITEFAFYLPASILIVLMLMQILAQFTVSLIIEKNGVWLKNYTEKFFDWQSIEHVVLKDGLLSVNMQNNKVIQLEPDFTEPVIIIKGGSLDNTKWVVGEDYPELERAVNEFYSRQSGQ